MSDMTGHAGESFVAYLKDRLPLIERALHEADAVAMSHEGAPTEDLDRYLVRPAWRTSPRAAESAYAPCWHCSEPRP